MENFQSVCPPIRADLDMIIMSAPGAKAVHPISLKIFLFRAATRWVLCLEAAPPRCLYESMAIGRLSSWDGPHM